VAVAEEAQEFGKEEVEILAVSGGEDFG